MTNAELVFAPATDLAQLLRTGAISAVELLEVHLQHIERVNPHVNAIITLVPDQALVAARNADAARQRGDVLSPLHGLPVAHKDLTLTKGIRTTFGSPLHRDFVPDVDALIVERLRQAGAITIGKTNVPEFGAGSQTFNPIFGATCNPYDLAKTCGGSSGGAAVALACGMIPIADGSDMGGSLRNPAAYCNVVGLRPSPGRVPSWPNENAWDTLSVVGPMARTVADVALLLSVMAGPDPRSPISVTQSGSIFAVPLDRDFRGVRIAWSRDLGGLPFDERVQAPIAAQIATFAALGCVIDEATPDLSDADEVFKVLRAWSFALGSETLLHEHREQLKDTIIWNVEQGLRLSGSQVAGAERKHTALYQRMRVFMEQYEFLICPVTQVPPFDVTQPYPTAINGVEMETYIDWMKSCYYISATGHPAATVPCGFTPEGLPVGIQIVGRYRDELGVLQLAYAFEQATQIWRKRPPLMPGTIGS